MLAPEGGGKPGQECEGVTGLFRPTALVSNTPPRAVPVTSVVTSTGLILASPQAWPLWARVSLGLVPWIPALAFSVTWNYRRYHWLALFYILLVTQTGHFLEHVTQMIQLHLLGLPDADARGIFGALDLEWVHFAWNIWVLLAATVLLWHFRDNAWLMIATLFAGWHGIEHGYILKVYLDTGVVGTPGLLSRGGLIGGGLPVPRPDLHFMYNLIETVPLAFAFFWQTRHINSARRARGARAPERRLA